MRFSLFLIFLLEGIRAELLGVICIDDSITRANLNSLSWR
jgi:hypothetical protein